MDNTKGMVWLVGAGPGDPGLLTLRAQYVLAHADVVVHDSLIAPAILAMIPSGAQRIHAGKRAAHHTMPQQQIHQLLILHARAGKRVVRLKGGDPFLFGRGGEELQALLDAGIPAQVVPGITSALAVPAYAGIPVTHRGISKSVHILSWHSQTGQSPDLAELEGLYQAGGTLVILMGAQAAQQIANQLLLAGYPPQTPAAILEEGTLGSQRARGMTLLALSGATIAVRSPAIVVVGEVSALGPTLSWVENLPLFGARVVVTRPQPHNQQLCLQLQALGAQAIPFPCIEVARLGQQAPPAAWLQAIQEVSKHDWLVFTSGHGVHAFWAGLAAAGVDVRRLAPCRMAAVGTSTAAVLQEYGFIADYVPQVFDGEHLGQGLAQRMLPGQTALLIRARNAAPALPAVLQAAGVAYHELPVYDTAHTQAAEAVRTAIEAGKFDVVLFTSSATVDGFVQAFAGMDFSRIRALCIGTPTQQRAQSAGMQARAAGQATVEGMCQTLAEWIAKEGGHSPWN